MPSVFKKEGSPYYYAAFTGSDGARKQKSTKQRDRAPAVEIAREWDKLAAKARRGAATEAQARRVVSEIMEGATGEALQFYTCREWFAEWLAGKKGAVEDGTVEKYEQVTKDFLEHMGRRADLTLAGVSVKDVRSFRDALKHGGRVPSTVNQIIKKSLSVPFTAAQRQGFIATNPCAGVENLSDDDAEDRETFTPAQVASLIAAAEEDWKGAILTGYYTGLRLRDVAELQWNAIDFDRGVLQIMPRKTRRKKKTIILPLHEDLADWLRRRPRGIARAPVFPSLAGKGTGGRHGLSGRFKAIMEKAEISGKRIRTAKGAGRTTSTLSFHSLRHSFVSALANAGVTPELRKRLSGHSDDKSHARYTHHEIEVLRVAVEKVPRLSA